MITLKDSERTRCEIWSRVMGYHRPISTWNIGKQQEFEDRVMFNEKLGTCRCSCVVSGCADNSNEQRSNSFGLYRYYKFDMEQRTC